MHIMHLIESLEFGGAEKVVVHLANCLNETDNVSICLTKRMGELVAELNPNIKVHFLDSGEGNSLAVPQKILKLVNSEKIDILHSHDWGVFLEAAVVSSQTKTCSLIHTIHGHYTHYPVGMASTIKKSLRHFLERYFSRFCYRFVAVSDAIRQYIIADIGISSDKLSTIHNGIADLNKCKKITGDSGIHDAIHLKSNKVRFIWVGRMAVVKNLPLLIRSFANACLQMNSIELVLIGDGIVRQEMEKLVKLLGMQTKIKFLGFRSDISQQLLASDVFLISSAYEGISIAVLEAMSLSLPVIATNVGGVCETVIDGITGRLVESDDSTGYCNALIELASSSILRQKMGQAGYSHFCDKFDEPVVLGQYRTLYSNCVSANL